MKVICAGCGTLVKTLPDDDTGRSQVYGQCEPCEKLVFRSNPKPAAVQAEKKVETEKAAE